MGKSAILPTIAHTICRPIKFKKQVLFFEKIYIDESSLNLTLRKLNIVSDEAESTLANNLSEIELLAKEGIVEFRNVNQGEKLEVIIQDHFINQQKEIINSYCFPWVVVASSVQLKMMDDLATILKAEDIEAYPLYFKGFKLPAEKKENIISFTLSKIPEPDNDEPWEKIFEFRKDPNTLAKYFRLINWINEISKSNLDGPEIKDRFEYLYHDYVQQYKLYKMKFDLGKMEVWLKAGLELLTGRLSAAFATLSLLEVRKQNINLLEAEGKFSGKEVAYIYETEDAFKKIH